VKNLDATRIALLIIGAVLVVSTVFIGVIRLVNPGEELPILSRIVNDGVLILGGFIGGGYATSRSLRRDTPTSIDGQAPSDPLVPVRPVDTPAPQASEPNSPQPVGVSDLDVRVQADVPVSSLGVPLPTDASGAVVHTGGTNDKRHVEGLAANAHQQIDPPGTADLKAALFPKGSW
jgi:hypothetical protein